MLIYDFDAKVRDKYMTVTMDDHGSFHVNTQMIEVCVIKTDTVMVNGCERKRQYLSPFGDWPITQHIAVEGIGINIGAVYLPQYDLLPSLDPAIDVFMFDSMTDAEGNVLFTGADFDAPAYDASVPEVGFDMGRTQSTDSKMYDLNGREIRNPLPGTVYILNGEKHVAK